jgi:hypothetical protein
MGKETPALTCHFYKASGRKTPKAASGRKFRIMRAKRPKAFLFFLRILILCLAVSTAGTAYPVALVAEPHARGTDEASGALSVSWDANRPLRWEDFQGPVRRGAPDNIAAETNCGIGIETGQVRQHEKAHVAVSNRFDKSASWVRPGHAQPDVLRHEQGHWDICELYTRKMQARFDAAEITGANLKTEAQRIYDEVTHEYLARQQLYEEETQHGTLPAQQARWDASLAKELAASSPGEVR